VTAVSPEHASFLMEIHALMTAGSVMELKAAMKEMTSA
jgi:hypothetical protein